MSGALPAPPGAALLVLEDGTALRGEGFGASGTTFGEIIFNTALTGYQEVLTDPSYHRQIVMMTGAHQGNYGVNPTDAEAPRVQVAGFVVREASRVYSNWRASGSLQDYLTGARVVGISEVDTRALTRHIRSAGAMRAGVSTQVLDADELLAQVRRSPGVEGVDLATEVSVPSPYAVTVWDARYRVVAYDFGMKANILRQLTQHGCAVTVVPATTPAEDVLAREPDGVFLSNGPGDPAAVRAGIDACRVLLGKVPVFGICLGHQLLGHAVGAQTFKMRFGHRGANQPVRDLDGGIEITSHNHGFAVDPDTLPSDGPFGRVAASHVNLNDGTNEGLVCHDVPAFSVQYHPEAAPGPHDARHLFERFTRLMSAVNPGCVGSARGVAGVSPAFPESGGNPTQSGSGSRSGGVG